MLDRRPRLRSEGELEIVPLIYQMANLQLGRPNDVGKILQEIWNPENEKIVNFLGLQYQKQLK